MELFTIRNTIIFILIVLGVRYINLQYNKVDTRSLVLPLGTKVLAFGDSLTYGYGASISQSYPAVLSSLLHVEVFNEGISGEMSDQGLRRLPDVLQKYQPDILVLCHGANDILHRRDLDKMKNNLSKMIEIAHAKGVYVLLVGVPTYDILTYNVPSLYYDLAQKNGLQIEDKALKKILETENLKSDQVHPNALGYTVMAERIAKLLSENYHPLTTKTF